MASSLPVFDTTVQETNAWLKAIARELAPAAATRPMCARSPAPGSGDELRRPVADPAAGLFAEGWRPSQTLTQDRDVDGLLARIEAALPPDFPAETESLARGVLRGLTDLMDHGLLTKVLRKLPLPPRALWPQTLVTL